MTESEKSSKGPPSVKSAAQNASPLRGALHPCTVKRILDLQL